MGKRQQKPALQWMENEKTKEEPILLRLVLLKVRHYEVWESQHVPKVALDVDLNRNKL